MEVPLILQSSVQSSNKKWVTFTVEERGNGNQIHIQITDAHDPLFLLTLIMTESDFQTLRSQQSLRVGFSDFCGWIKGLLSRCVEESKLESPKFNLILTQENELVFEQVDPYKSLCYLSLKMIQGTDGHVKEYLAERLKAAKESHDQLRLDFDQQSSELKRLNLEIRALQDEKASFSAKLFKEVDTEKEKSAQKLEELQARHEAERRQLIDEHAKTFRMKENRIASLEYENKDLSDKRFKHEAKILNLSENVNSLEEELSALKVEVQSRSKEQKKILTELHRNERMNDQLRNEKALLERENQQLDKELQEQNKICSNQKQIVQNLDELVRKKESEIEGLDLKTKKANEIIRKCMHQSRSEHQKVKECLHVIQQNEELLKSRTEELESLREEVRQNSHALREAASEKNEAERKLKFSESQLHDMERKVQNDEAIIKWLNDQLNLAKARDPGLIVGAPPDGIKTFTPSGMAAYSTPVDQIRSTRPNVKRINMVGRKKNLSQEESLLAPLSSKQKENDIPTGLEDKYLQPSVSLPSNVRTGPKGGILRRTAAGPLTSQSSANKDIDSAYFPKT